MRHPQIEELSDYVRETLSDEVASNVKQHLDSGCRRCRQQVAELELVCALAAADRDLEVPPHALRSVQNLFRIQKILAESERPVSGLRLSFDSRLTPARAGTRRTAGDERHLVYRSPTHTLNLQLRSDSSSRQLEVKGQISCSGSGPVTDLPVFLFADGRVCSRDSSGEEGGFHLSGDPQSETHICFLVENDELIDLELPPL